MILCQQARVNVIPLDTIDTASGQVTVRYAMMFGKAAVATTSIGTEDYIEDGVTGLLVPPKDPAAMATAIKQLCGTIPRGARRWATPRGPGYWSMPPLRLVPPGCGTSWRAFGSAIQPLPRLSASRRRSRHSNWKIAGFSRR